MDTPKHIPYKNTSICYRDTGRGPALVLLHGFTESQTMWDGFISRLSDKFRVVTMDLPGHGGSGMLGEIHLMEDMAAAVKAVLDHLGITRSMFAGHSMGGYVSLAFMRAFPHAVSGLCLFHSTAMADSTEAAANRDKAIAVIRADRKDFLLQFIPSLFAPGNRDSLQDVIRKLIGEAQQMSAEAIIAAQEGMKRRKDCLDLLQNAPVPVLFIAGQQDARIPCDLVLEQVKLPAVSYLLLLKNTGHMGWAEAPGETQEAIARFAGLCS